MAETICNTSPLQYLHQAGPIGLLPSLVGSILIPLAVEVELAAGRALGVNLPDPATLAWITVHASQAPLSLPLATALGTGETEVLALAFESPDAVAILDDRLARQAAQTLGRRFRRPVSENLPPLNDSTATIPMASACRPRR